MSDYKEVVKQEWDEFKNEAHYPNIMLLGCTGCGKSSLINTVFGKNVARVSDAGRGTTEFNIYYGKDNGSCVNLIDSMGYEMGSEEDCDKYIRTLRDWIDKHSNTKDDVHIIWYCVQVIPNRFQAFDARVLKSLISNPRLREKIAVVITKCDQDDENGNGAAELRNVAHEDVSPALEVLEVSNDPKLKLDIEKLVEWSSIHITDIEVRKMFVASQMVSLKEKRKTAALIISGATAAAAATGAIPIPGPDAPIISAAQVAMAAGIISCYGLNIAKGVVTSLVGNVIVSNLGKLAVSSLIKVIPAVGTLIGGVINGAVAGSITAALGFAISEICYNCCKKIAAGVDPISLDFAAEFNFDAINSTMTSFLKKNGNKSTEELEKIIETEGEEK